MRAHDCSHPRGSGRHRRHVQATALVTRPRRGIELACPVGDARLARLAAGDERVRTELLLWAYAAAIPAVLVLAALTALAGPVAGVVVLVLATAVAALVTVATLAASRRFVVFSTEGSAADDLDRLERCAGSLAVATEDLSLLGEQEGTTHGAVVHAMGAARRRLDAAREASRAAGVLVGGASSDEARSTPLEHPVGEDLVGGDLVALAAADARAMAAAHRRAAAAHLRAAHDVLRAARSLTSARAAELGRAGTIVPTGAADRTSDGGELVVSDLDELATRARAEQVATELTLRADALTALA